jgi:hypothetical protein
MQHSIMLLKEVAQRRHETVLPTFIGGKAQLKALTDSSPSGLMQCRAYQEPRRRSRCRADLIFSKVMKSRRRTKDPGEARKESSSSFFDPDLIEQPS